MSTINIKKAAGVRSYVYIFSNSNRRNEATVNGFSEFTLTLTNRFIQPVWTVLICEEARNPKVR